MQRGDTNMQGLHRHFGNHQAVMTPIRLVDKSKYNKRFVNQEPGMIHDRIRRARQLQGMSLEALAKSLGDISKQGLSKFEKGDAKPNSTRILLMHLAN